MSWFSRIVLCKPRPEWDTCSWQIYSVIGFDHQTHNNACGLSWLMTSNLQKKLSFWKKGNSDIKIALWNNRLVHPHPPPEYDTLRFKFFLYDKLNSWISPFLLLDTDSHTFLHPRQYIQQPFNFSSWKYTSNLQLNFSTNRTV